MFSREYDINYLIDYKLPSTLRHLSSVVKIAEGKSKVSDDIAHDHFPAEILRATLLGISFHQIMDRIRRITKGEKSREYPRIVNVKVVYPFYIAFWRPKSSFLPLLLRTSENSRILNLQTDKFFHFSNFYISKFPIFRVFCSLDF